MPDRLFDSFLVSLLVVLVGGTVLFSLFILAGSLIFNADLQCLQILLLETGLNEPGFIKFTLIAQDISFFIIPAADYSYKI